MGGYVVGPTFLERYAALFWDFDGVIKESVEIKTLAFVRLFEPFGSELAVRVRAHHECNGGMSRFDKIPIYLQWAGVLPTEQEVQHYCAEFSAAVRKAVIDSPWVPGVREYLQLNNGRQNCVLVTATPQEEIEDIVRELAISNWFSEICGAPLIKADAIDSVIRRSKCKPEQALLIGDSEADYAAALSTGIDFLLRRTPLNRALQQRYDGPHCESLLNG